MKIKNNSFYENAEEKFFNCNFCGADNFEVIAKIDRNRLPAQTVICKNCGLIYLNPRMTPESYGKYYKEGEYRRQMARFKGVSQKIEYNSDTQFQRAFGYGKMFGEMMRPYVRKGLTIDVGSNAGGVLAAFKEFFNVPVLGVEPAEEAAQYANSKNIRTICSLFENLNEDVGKASNILNIRTLDHMQDPRQFFYWANSCLEAGGYLLLDVVNFLDIAKFFNYLPRAIQISHIYMFTPETLRQFLETLGFEIVFLNFKKPKNDHVYIAAIKVKDVALQEGMGKNYEKTYRSVKEQIQKINGTYLGYLMKFGVKRRVFASVRKIEMIARRAFLY